MKFIETPIKGIYLIELEKRSDERGFFARFFCEREYEQHGLNHHVAQINTSLSRERGTMRGIHYQLAPKAEDKITRVTRGSIFVAFLDLRPDSPTFLKHHPVELSAENRTMLYVPKGCTQGYMTLEDDTETLYLATEFYSPEHERGIRYDDPTFGIRWPMEPVVISDKDRNHPLFNPATHLK